MLVLSQAVKASDVTDASAEALASADYGSYFDVTDDEKDCIVAKGYVPPARQCLTV